MTGQEFAVSPETLQLADHLDAVAATVRHYMDLPHAPWPDSIVSREQANGDAFSTLPWKYPAVHVSLMPMNHIGVAHDHLTAIAAVLRTPRTVMAMFTLERTMLVAAAQAFWVLDTTIDQRERTRRVINLDLQSKTEQMHIVAGRTDAESVVEFARLDASRQELAKAAKHMGWTTNTPSTPKSGRVREWYVGAPLDKETHVLQRFMGVEAEVAGYGATLYRYLSAISHAQPHGTQSFIRPEQTMPGGDGWSTATIGLDGTMLITLSMITVGALTAVLDRACRYYGWSPDTWLREVSPFFESLRTAAGAPTFYRGLPLLG